MIFNERVTMCEDCQNAEHIYDFGDFHEYCEAGICMLCFQTGKVNCDNYVAKEHTLTECIKENAK